MHPIMSPDEALVLLRGMAVVLFVAINL